MIFKSYRDFFSFFSVVLGFFIALLDTTIVSITLPVMTRFYSADVSEISWVVSGYNLAFAVCLIAASRLADQFGRKKIFLLGLVFFIVTSFLCGQATTVQWLIFFRVLQGLAGAMVVPVTMPMAIRLFPAEKSGAVVGIWAAISALAAASGPSLGGIIAQYFPWQWIFYINIPIGILAVIMTAFLIEESFDETASRHIDVGGIMSLMAGTLCITLGLIEANQYGWTSFYIIRLFVFALISLGLYVVNERFSVEPMFPLSMLKTPSFVGGILTLFMIGIGTMDGVFFLSFFLTEILGMSQLKAGITVSIIPISSIGFSILAGYFSDKVGSMWFTVAGMAFFVLALVLFSQLTPASTMNDLIIRMVVCGIGMGVSASTVVVATLRSVPPEKSGIASGVGNMTRVLGNVFGAAIVVTLFNGSLDKLIPVAVKETSALIQSSTVLKPSAKKEFSARLAAAESGSGTQRSIPSQADMSRLLDKKEAEAIDQSSDMMKPAVKKVYEKQKAEAMRLYPLVKASFKRQAAFAFSHTFRVCALILVFGILFAFFSDPGKDARKRKVDFVEM